MYYYAGATTTSTVTTCCWWRGRGRRLNHTFQHVWWWGGGSCGGLITLLSMYVLGDFHLTWIVSGIRLSQVKEIYPIPKGQEMKRFVLGICVLCDTFVIVLLFVPLLICFWLNLYFLDI